MGVPGKEKEYGREERIMCKNCKITALRIFWTALLLLGVSFSASAENQQKISDAAGILSADEENALQEQMLQTAERYECDVAAAAVESCGSRTPGQFAEDYYLSNGYGYGAESDGIFLLVSMGDRQFYYATFGKATEIFTDYGLERIDEIVTPYLSDGEYYEAFSVFGKLAAEFAEEWENGRAFDTDHKYKEEMSIVMRLLISLAAGLAAAGLILAGLFAQLKSVRARGGAYEYIREGSFRVTRQRDVFLYRTVTRIKREKPQSGGSTTHHSSSGGRVGGRGGSF